eukprot:1194278-Prorocentrum_minimum.AAC.4
MEPGKVQMELGRGSYGTWRELGGDLSIKSRRPIPRSKLCVQILVPCELGGGSDENRRGLNVARRGSDGARRSSDGAGGNEVELRGAQM